MSASPFWHGLNHAWITEELCGKSWFGDFSGFGLCCDKLGIIVYPLLNLFIHFQTNGNKASLYLLYNYNEERQNTNQKSRTKKKHIKEKV